MNEREVARIQQEIEELEREAADPFTSAEHRYALELRAHLLRNGYRLVEVPMDKSVFHVIHLISGASVMNVSRNELRYARMGKQGWVDVLDRRHRENMRERQWHRMVNQAKGEGEQ